MTRSLSAVLSFACLCILALCLFLAHAISVHMQRVYVEPVFQTMDRIELQDARSALEEGGRAKLAAYLERLNRQFGGVHFLLDAQGRDVNTGVAHIALLPPPPETHTRAIRHGVLTLAQRSGDGAYWFAAINQLPSGIASFGRFYLLITGVVLALGVFATAYIVLPLRGMAYVVERLGTGDLGARIGTTRRDEIGALANAYNTMADRLQAAFRRERQLLQDVSHELRAPLTRLNFSTHLARTAPDRDAALDEVKRDLNRLAFLISELTELSLGPPGGAVSTRVACVDFEAIVADAVRDAGLEAAAKGCALVCTGCAQTLIAGEAEPLRRAVENILRNAVRHSPAGVPVEIGLRQTEQWSYLTIRDFGEGVPRDLLETIFDPFFQVNSARAASGNGLGLGLSIARRAVELHGGSIGAENAGPGLRMTMQLPIRRPLSDARLDRPPRITRKGMLRYPAHRKSEKLGV